MQKTPNKMKYALAALILTLVGISGVAQAAPKSMVIGDVVNPPIGVMAFCMQNADQCATTAQDAVTQTLTAQAAYEMNRINRGVNLKIKYVEDQAKYGRNDFWTYPSDREGDCEDIALEKRKMLIRLGWNPASLVFAAARTETGEGHLVLVAITDRGDFVLDNRRDEVPLWSDVEYTWIKRSKPGTLLAWNWIDKNSGIASLSAVGAE